MTRLKTPVARLAAVWLAAPLILAGGCDSGPPMGKVNGVVLYGGKPVAQGTVQFFPVSPGPMSAGRIQEDGRFELITKTPGDGALVGEHVVVVVPPSDLALIEHELKPGQPMTSKFEDIPRVVRNQNSSPLSVKVESGANEFQIDLKEMTVAGGGS